MEDKKVTTVGFRVDAELAREFKTMCVSRGTSIQFILTQAMKEYVARESAKKKAE